MATLLIGRHPDCDVVVDDPTVSRRHIEVSAVGPELFMVVDQGSTSGTFRLDGGEWKRFASVRLRATDRLRLGAYEATLGDLLGKARIAGQGPSEAPHRTPAASPPRVERDPATGQIVVRER